MKIDIIRDLDSKRLRPLERDGGTSSDVEAVRQLVRRVMDGGKMTRLEACAFVGGLFEGLNGLAILHIIEGNDYGYTLNGRGPKK